MNQNMDALHKKIETWVNSEEGQKELQRIAVKTRKERLEREKACQVRIEDLYRPVTI